MGFQLSAELQAKVAAYRAANPAKLATPKKRLADCRTFAELLPHCPASYDHAWMRKIDDLYIAAKDQVDLLDQGEESDIENGRQRRTWVAFVNRCAALCNDLPTMR